MPVHAPGKHPRTGPRVPPQHSKPSVTTTHAISDLDGPLREVRTHQLDPGGPRPQRYINPRLSLHPAPNLPGIPRPKSPMPHIKHNQQDRSARAHACRVHTHVNAFLLPHHSRIPNPLPKLLRRRNPVQLVRQHRLKPFPMHFPPPLANATTAAPRSYAPGSHATPPSPPNILESAQSDRKSTRLNSSHL